MAFAGDADAPRWAAGDAVAPRWAAGDAVAPRWAQLTYASFDPGNGSGGWQVKESRGDLAPAELREISAHLVTAFDAHTPLPEYPTPDDVAVQPRRCVHLLGYGGPIGAGSGQAAGVTAGCTIHAVQAGSDSTGRPGNVFSHAVLDRRPGEPAPRLRPIELWRSFDLLTPYGTEQVLAARLRDGDYPNPSGLVGRDLVLDFVFEFDSATWRMGVLSVLLDAVDEAMRGGRRVALVTSSPDQAALWIGAVSWCMAASTARTFSWSVYERAARLRTAFDRGVHLACVPRADAGGLDPDEPGVIVIDDRVNPSLGQLGATPHRTAAGHEVAVTPWSSLALEALVDGPTAAGVLALVDDIADRVADRFLTPSWPLAIAQLMMAAERADTTVASRVAVAEAPVGELDAWISERLRDAVAAGLGETAEDAWSTVAGAPPGSRQAALAGAEYVRRALADAEWLVRRGGVPSPRPDPALAQNDEVRGAYTAALDLDDPAAVLRAIDLGVRTGLVDDAGLRQSTVEALRDRVAPLLLASALVPAGETGDGEGSHLGDRASFLERVGELDPRIHRELVPQSLRSALGAIDGDAQPPALLEQAAGRWLTMHGLPSDRNDTRSADPLALELELWNFRSHPGAPGAGSTLARALLGRYGSWYGIPTELRVLEPRHLWRAAELVEIERAHPGGLPERFLTPNLACAPPSPELTALAAAVALRSGTHAARVAAVRLEAEAVHARQPVVPVAEVLGIAADLHTTNAPHFAVNVFAPLVVEAAVMGAADPLTASDWPVSWFPVLRDCAAIDGIVAAAASNLAAHLADAPESARITVIAGIVALDISTSPTCAAGLTTLSAQARAVGALVDAGGHRIVETLTDAIVADGVSHGAIVVAAADRLAAADRRTPGDGLSSADGAAGDTRAAEFERLARQRLRDVESRRSGVGWFRTSRPRQEKEH